MNTTGNHTKNQGNITMGKTIARHMAAGTLKPYTVVRFYGANVPDRLTNQDVYVTGWYNSTSGGYIITLRVPVGETFADSTIGVKPEDKVGVYTDQEDAKAAFYGTK